MVRQVDWIVEVCEVCVVEVCEVLLCYRYCESVVRARDKQTSLALALLRCNE